MNLISTAYCLLWAAQTHIQRMQNDVHMCVQICIIYMCARAEGDGTLRDGRLRVADGLIPHIHLSYQGKEGKPFLADVSEDTEIQLVFALTQRELWRVVIDISEGDFDLCCPRQSSHVTAHVFGLDDNIVFLASLTVHVWQGSTDYT